MKKVVATSTYDYFSPSITKSEAADVILSLREDLMSRLITRYPEVSVKVGPTAARSDYIGAQLSVVNGGVYSGEYVFQFDAYPEYFDRSDYISHLMRERIKFIDSILRR